MADLRPYQVEGIDRLRQSLSKGAHRTPVLQIATGGGKTKCAAAIINMARERGTKVAFCVPALSLIDQTVRMFVSEGISYGDIGVIQASHSMEDWSKPIQVCSVQTLARRKAFPDVKLVIVDECHVVHKAITQWITESKIPFIGLSATPWAKGLGRIYDDLVVVAGMQQLIDQGYLSPFKVFAPAHPDLTGVKVLAGDYHEGQLSDAMNKPEIVADVVSTWVRLSGGRPTVCFAVDLAHARALQDQFVEAGVPAGYQDAATTAGEREIIRKQFHDGALKVVCNVGTLTTGIDWDIRCLILARPTKSEILYTQIVGRALRPAEGKDYALILDHSDNTTRLGFVTDIHHEHLDGHALRGQSEKKPPLPKECPKCSFLRPARTRICPNCGFEVVAQPQVKQTQGELAELQREGGSCKVSRSRKTVSISGEEIPLATFYGALRAYAKSKDWKDGWASNKYREAVGVWPNAYRDAPECAVPPLVKDWITSRNIAYAKRKIAAQKAPPVNIAAAEDREIAEYIAQRGVTRVDDVDKILRGEA